jgi:hypothetical protein
VGSFAWHDGIISGFAGIAALRALADARWDRDDGHGAAGSDATLGMRHG